MKKIFQTLLATFISLSLIGQTYSGTARYNELNEKYANGSFKAAEGTILDVENEVSAAGYINILNWLQGRVAGLQVYTSRTGTPVPYIRGSRARIFVDEMQMDASFLNSLPVSDIAMIKVIRAPFAGAFGNSSAIAIYTIQPEEEEEE